MVPGRCLIVPGRCSMVPGPWTLEDDPAKFLGSSLTYRITPADHFSFLRDKMEEKLTNLDQVNVKGEYKVATYSRYVLPSLRFHLSVHNIHQCHLESLDLMAKKFLKKWMDFPRMGACDLSIFHPSILGIKKPSQVYLEGHIGAHIQSRMLGDRDVQEALNTRLARERTWTKKSSTTVQCEEIFQELELDQFLPRLEEDPPKYTP